MAAINAPAGFPAPGRYVAEGPDEKGSPAWVEVNPATWKLTDGTLSRTPACHGKWGSFATERVLVWVIDVGWPCGKASWYVRRGDNSYGPTNLAKSFLSGAPVPENKGAHSFIGPINLNAAAIRTAPTIDSDSEWIDWLADEGAP